jgi:CHAT domain-containing protein
VIRARQAHDDVAADPDTFRPAAEAIVAEARRARQPEALALALRALAWAERSRRDDRSAVRLLDQASRIARRHHLADTLADVLMTRAAVSQELGRMAAAHRDLRAAAALVSGTRTAELDFQRALLMQNTGRLAEAAEIYLRMLSDPGVSARRTVLGGNNLALIESHQGRYGQALRRLGQALRQADEVGPAVVAVVATSRAWVTVQSGRFAEGLGLFEEAAKAHREAALPLGEHYIEYADALMELRLLPEAISAARQAVQEFSAVGIPLMAAEAQVRVAQLALLAGDASQAIAASIAAAAAFQEQRRGEWLSRAVLITAEARLTSGAATLADLSAARTAAQRLETLGMTPAAVQGLLVTGRLATSFGRPRQAIAALTRASSLARGAPVLVRLRGRISSALAARLSQRDHEALAQCRRGLSDLARHRGGLPSVELRALASGHGAELGAIGLDVVIRDGSPARVLKWMERSRTAALLAIEPPEFDHIRADLTALRAVRTDLRDKGTQATGPAILAHARTQQATAERAEIENRIRQATWRAAAVPGASTVPVTVGELRDHLDGRALIEYGLLGNDLVAVLVDAHGARISVLGPVAPVREQLRMFLFALRRLTRPRPQADHAAVRTSADLHIHRLSELLLEPLKVPADVELVIVPVADLQDVPWSALHGAPVCLAPSATFWARSVAAAQDRAHAETGTVVLVAGPDLPGAIAEVESLAAIHPSAAVFTPPASTAEVVTGALANADLAHLACHGMLRADNPMFSSLLLSDGQLTLQELYARGLAPRRLILAACESGTHVSYAGNEVLGFVSALLARGTAGILASMANVPDVNAVDLMTAVHDRLARGATLARALHGARETQDIDDPASYVNWCIFNAHGAA